MDILRQFNPEKSVKNYVFGRVTAVSGIKLTIVTATGLQISITDSDRAYSVGDQLVLGQNGNLNSLFIIRKASNLFPASGNSVIITDGQG